MDRVWWDRYGKEAAREFKGFRVTQLEGVPGVARAHLGENFLNSGANAIALAAYLGAERVILLGYDCQRTAGLAHWHGDHPAGLGNAGTLPKWPLQFQKLADSPRLEGVEVVNATRETALACFPRVRFEDIFA